MYHFGQGVPEDYVQAYLWYNLAAARLTGQERESAVDGRDEVAGQLTRAALNEAQRLAGSGTPRTRARNIEPPTRQR